MRSFSARSHVVNFAQTSKSGHTLSNQPYAYAGNCNEKLVVKRIEGYISTPYISLLFVDGENYYRGIPIVEPQDWHAFYFLYS